MRGGGAHRILHSRPDKVQVIPGSLQLSIGIGARTPPRRRTWTTPIKNRKVNLNLNWNGAVAEAAGAGAKVATRLTFDGDEIQHISFGGVRRLSSSSSSSKLQAKAGDDDPTRSSFISEAAALEISKQVSSAIIQYDQNLDAFDMAKIQWEQRKNHVLASAAPAAAHGNLLQFEKIWVKFIHGSYPSLERHAGVFSVLQQTSLLANVGKWDKPFLRNLYMGMAALIRRAEKSKSTKSNSNNNGGGAGAFLDSFVSGELNANNLSQFGMGPSQEAVDREAAEKVQRRSQEQSEREERRRHEMVQTSQRTSSIISSKQDEYARLEEWRAHQLARQAREDAARLAADARELVLAEERRVAAELEAERVQREEAAEAAKMLLDRKMEDARLLKLREDERAAREREVLEDQEREQEEQSQTQEDWGFDV